MSTIYIETVSILGPGFPNWPLTKKILSGRAPYHFTPTESVNCSYLKPNIKRRTTLHMQIALHVVEKIFEQSVVNPSSIELLLASSEGDLNIADEIFKALSLPDKLVLPQKFQNVILSAAIGHLGIILKNRSSATSVSGGEYSFPVGLLHAATCVTIEKHPVLFVAYDCLGPYYLDPRTTSSQPFSLAILLSPKKTTFSKAKLKMEVTEGKKETKMKSEILEQVRCSLGAARSLPLLEALSQNLNSTLLFKLCEKSQLNVEFVSC